MSLGACAIASDDTDETDESEMDQDLNGSLSPSGYLTKRTFAEPNETSRELETTSYYNTVRLGFDGTGIETISSDIPTLASFISFYGFGAADAKAYYYNRGDLGIGREMHCISRINTTGEVACYVRNFAAGDDGTEWTFGLSSNIAFQNLEANHSFATVAMVYRNQAPAGSNPIFFVVYDAAGNLAKAAPLDRHGLFFNNEFVAEGHTPTDTATFGVPGVNHNNQIPTNCMSCHGTGSSYGKATHTVRGALFLPFDLDQFDYESVAGRTRADQLAAFTQLNQMVRVVDATANVPGGAGVTAQLDTWYNNTVLAPSPKNEVFENPFNSNAVPPGWSAHPTEYLTVIKPRCRNCHMTDATYPFDTETNFNQFGALAAGDLCSYKMPHALQTLRQFWQSTAPQVLEKYWQTASPVAATTLASCAAGSIVTLDPPLIASSLVP